MRSANHLLWLMASARMSLAEAFFYCQSPAPTRQTRKEHLIMDTQASAEPAPATAPNGQERNVVALGWVAFFGGLAQAMIQPILPIFYESALA